MDCILIEWEYSEINLPVYNSHPWDQQKWLLYHGDQLIIGHHGTHTDHHFVYFTGH